MRSYVPPTARQEQIISEIMQLAREFNSGLLLHQVYCDKVSALWREHDACNERPISASQQCRDLAHQEYLISVGEL